MNSRWGPHSGPMSGLPPGLSRTSVYVAAGRAVGAREPDRSVRNPDYLAEKFLGDPSAFDIDHPAVRALSLPYDEAINDIEVVNTVRMMMVRTRFIDDALARAIAGGATQVLILGAGFDSHAYRCQQLLAGVNVFEVDRQAMQALKKQRVNEVLGGPPPNLTYVAIDFQQERLEDVLPRCGYDLAQPTFFILEGVTMYLPEDAVRRTLRFVAAHPAGSSIAFDFTTDAVVELLARTEIANVPALLRPAVERNRKMTKDEPWVFGFPWRGEREFLRECGLELRETLTVGGEESARRYLTKADGTQVGARALADSMVRVREYMQRAGQSDSGAQTREQEQLMAVLMAYQLAEAVVPRRG